MSLIEKAVARLDATQGGRTPEGIDAIHIRDNVPLSAFAPRPRREDPKAAREPMRFGPAFELPLAQLRERGIVTPAARATATGQEFRSIKGQVLERAFGTEAQQVAGGRLVVVTSALPDEGKTFCAINLAISVAITGQCQVLLVDADVARPSVAEVLGLQSVAGLIDILKGTQPEPHGLIFPCDVPGLHVMPAGKAQAHAGETLASRAMTSLLDELCGSLPGWLIILDTPPLLAITEMRALAQRVGQVVLVVAAGATPRRVVDTALASVEGLSNVSLLLNKVPPSKTGLDYYYGY